MSVIGEMSTAELMRDERVRKAYLGEE